MGYPGSLVSAVDDVDQPFIYCICLRCAARVDKLPVQTQYRQLAIAARRVAANPDRHLVRVCHDTTETRLLVALSARGGPEEALRLFNR